MSRSLTTSPVAPIRRSLCTSASSYKTFYRMRIDAEHLSPTYKRLGELYEAKGDKAKAVGYSQKFAELWKNADAELQPQVRAVKDKLARLQKQGG